MIRTPSPILAAAIAIIHLCNPIYVPADAGALARDFAKPPASARPWVYWFWINGNISKSGITADLEAMKRVGIGGVLWMEVSGMAWAPDGPVTPASPQWHDCMQWALRECARLGMEFDLSVDFGYGSGGPHITPELSMQKLYWSETKITGGQQVNTVLAKPVVEKKLWDDGTNGDATAGDSIFTRKTFYSPDSVNIGSKDRVGQTFKFGIRGGDNEGGKGGFGNNHNENIVDTDSIYTMDTQFGSINPAFYDAWNYDLRIPQVPTSVFEPGKPLVYELAQNYPNPFNPTTKIEYSIPAQVRVELRVYNLVGQEVATLVNDVQSAGVHFVKFNATNLASGVYFYRLVAGDFVSVKKMVLLK